MGIFEIRKNRRRTDRQFTASDHKKALPPAGTLVTGNLLGLVAGSASFTQMQDADRHYCQE